MNNKNKLFETVWSFDIRHSAGNSDILSWTAVQCLWDCFSLREMKPAILPLLSQLWPVINKALLNHDVLLLLKLILKLSISSLYKTKPQEMKVESPVDTQGSRDEGKKLKRGFEANINVEISFCTLKCVIKRLIF